MTGCGAKYWLNTDGCTTKNGPKACSQLKFSPGMMFARWVFMGTSDLDDVRNLVWIQTTGSAFELLRDQAGPDVRYSVYGLAHSDLVNAIHDRVWSIFKGIYG